MGIDVYLNWDRMSQKDEEAQITGFDTTQGHIGYLREAYHGGPYATHVLMPEGWDEEANFGGGGVKIGNDVLQERLPAAIKAAEERARRVYDEDLDPAVQESLRGFVELHGIKEDAGLNPRIVVSY